MGIAVRTADGPGAAAAGWPEISHYMFELTSQRQTQEQASTHKSSYKAVQDVKLLGSEERTQATLYIYRHFFYFFIKKKRLCFFFALMQ